MKQDKSSPLLVADQQQYRCCVSSEVTGQATSNGSPTMEQDKSSHPCWSQTNSSIGAASPARLQVRRPATAVPLWGRINFRLCWSLTNSSIYPDLPAVVLTRPIEAVY